MALLSHIQAAQTADLEALAQVWAAVPTSPVREYAQAMIGMELRSRAEDEQLLATIRSHHIALVALTRALEAARCTAWLHYKQQHHAKLLEVVQAIFTLRDGVRQQAELMALLGVLPQLSWTELYPITSTLPAHQIVMVLACHALRHHERWTWLPFVGNLVLYRIRQVPSAAQQVELLLMVSALLPPQCRDSEARLVADIVGVAARDHSAACLAQRLERQQWHAQWPTACAECAGSGVQRPPRGKVGICSNCLAWGQCPRCMHGAALTDQRPCPHCGWAWGRPGDQAIPVLCDCTADDEEHADATDRLA